MDVDLPKFPSPPIAIVPEPTPATLEQRSRHVLVNLGLAIGIVVLLIVAGRMADAVKQAPPPPPQPFAFEIVMSRHHEIMHTTRPNDIVLTTSLAEVEKIIGPPTHRDRNSVVPSDLRIVDLDSSYYRVWHRWVDPNNENRWLEILFAGPDGNAGAYKIYGLHKNGF